MSKKDRLTYEIVSLGEKYKIVAAMLVSILTGEALLLYAVVGGDKPIYTLFLGVAGLFFIIGLFSILRKLDDERNLKLDSLEEEV